MMVGNVSIQLLHILKGILVNYVESQKVHGERQKQTEYEPEATM